MMRPHKNLIVWQESVNFVEEIYTITNKYPDAEKFGIVSQLRRAAVSIPTNISEGAAKNSKKDFIRFLFISSGSISEVDTLMTISERLKYINQSEFHAIDTKLVRITSLLHGLIRKLKNEM